MKTISFHVFPLLYSKPKTTVLWKRSKFDSRTTDTI